MSPTEKIFRRSLDNTDSNLRPPNSDFHPSFILHSWFPGFLMKSVFSVTRCLLWCKNGCEENMGQQSARTPCKPRVTIKHDENPMFPERSSRACLHPPARFIRAQNRRTQKHRIFPNQILTPKKQHPNHV